MVIKIMRMRLLLVVMLVVLFLIINGSHGRIGDKTQARNNNRSSKSNIYKTIRTRIGDVFDCVDIYKQPSLDNLLLKNHKVQLNPNLNLKETTTTTKNTTSTAMYAVTELQISGGCPPGSVPIHRLKNTNNNNNTMDNNPWFRGTYAHWISLDPVHQGYFYGARAQINTQNLSVAIDQFSSSQIWVQSTYDGVTESIEAGWAIWVQSTYDGVTESIEAGWAVYPKIFGDSMTRIFGHWTSDGYLSTGCFNTFCPGFVQVHPTVALGDAFAIVSVYRGDQYVMDTTIYHDPESGNWWLVLNQKSGEDIRVGYWPKELFYELADHATDIRFGGVAGAEENRPSAPMGNGHYPYSDFSRACFMSHMKKVDEKRQIVDFDENKADTSRDIQTCYDLQYFPKVDVPMGISILFGGPGGDC